MKLKDFIKQIAKNPGNFEIYWGDFLDYFYRLNVEQKKKIVEKEPEEFEEISKKQYAFIAASIEKLCNDYNISPPNWVFKDKYFLEDPMFALDAQGDLRLVLLKESPNEFVVRNIFVTENCLKRV